MRDFRAFSYGTGEVDRSRLAGIGRDVVIENGALIFDPESVSLGSNVYIGHYAILRGYKDKRLVVGDDTYIGQMTYINCAGNVEIGSRVGIGPCVKIMSSFHSEEGRDVPVLLCDIEFAEVVIEDDCDIGMGAIILPGRRVGRGSIVGAGAVVTHDVEPYSIVAGVPARKIGERPK